MIYYDMVLICRLSTTFSQWPLEGDKDIGSGQANAQMCMMSVLDTKSQVGCVRMFFAVCIRTVLHNYIKDQVSLKAPIAPRGVSATWNQCESALLLA